MGQIKIVTLEKNGMDSKQSFNGQEAGNYQGCGKGAIFPKRVRDSHQTC